MCGCDIVFGGCSGGGGCGDIGNRVVDVTDVVEAASVTVNVASDVVARVVVDAGVAVLVWVLLSFVVV